MTLSHDQQHVLTKILEWYKTGKELKQFITLGGYAGTGKTTLIAHLRRELETIDPKLKVGFASYTGKATRVLKNKLDEQKVLSKQDTIGTIHSLIYSPMVNDKEEIIGWKPKEKIDRKLIVIDEGSMVDGTIWRHLLAYDIPIIVVGDHGQLPPIKGSFNLMSKPDLKLEEIHRQARQNPIIGLSIQAREHGSIRPATYSDTVLKMTNESGEMQSFMNELLQNYSSDTLILCGYNTTRKRLNSSIRQSMGFESPQPMSGDRVICLRNNHRKNIFNGMLGTIVSLEPKDGAYYNAEIEMDGEDAPYTGLISKEQFGSDTALNFTDKRAYIMAGDLFDFGYALTVHKAQGSQARRVILFEERFKQMSDDQWKQWLYTAVTRAEEELYIFAP
ncbi:AAA family ATPase [Candidatus Woesebacteria bacterium]|nr:AAA family ATPase [Candidatus Woesebacteria bacterium]